MAVLVRGRGVAVFAPDTGKPSRMLDVPGAEVMGCRRMAAGSRSSAAASNPPCGCSTRRRGVRCWAGASDPRSEPTAVRFGPDGRRLLATYWGGPVSAEVFAPVE